MMKIGLLVAAVLLGACNVVHADAAAYLIGIRVTVGSTTLDGYATYTSMHVMELTKGDRAPTMDEVFDYSAGLGGSIQFFPDPRKVSFPEPMFVSAQSPFQLIPRRFIEKYERKARPLDGEIFYGPYNAVPILALELLNRPPLFSCSEKDSWGQVKWVSYNPEWDADQMMPVCENPKSEAAERVRKFLRLSVPDVFELKFHVD